MLHAYIRNSINANVKYNAFSASSSHIRGEIAMFSQLLYCNVHVRKMTRNSYCFSPWIDRSNQDRVNSAAGKDWRTNELSSYLFQEASWRTVYTDITISRREPETRLFCRDLLPWPLYWFPDERSFDGNFLRWLMSTMEASVKPLSIVSQTYLSKFFFLEKLINSAAISTTDIYGVLEIYVQTYAEYVPKFTPVWVKRRLGHENSV